MDGSKVGVVVLCSASSLALTLAQVYSKQQLTILSCQETDSSGLLPLSEVSLQAGALFGCLLSWLPLRYLGRRATLQLVVTPLLTVGCCIVFAFHNMATIISPILLLGVSLQGAALGVSFSSTPIYIMETMYFQSTTENPGTPCAIIISTYLSSAIGTLLANIFPMSSGLHYLHLVPVTIIVTSSLGLCLANESPRWLLLFGKKAEQLKVALQLLQEHSASNYNPNNKVFLLQKDEEQFCKRKMSIAVMKLYLRTLLLAVCLTTMPCLCGVNVYQFYSSWTFRFSGISSHKNKFISVSILNSSVHVLAVGIASIVVHMSSGVRYMCLSIIISIATISIALATTGLCLFSLEQGENWIWVVPWLPLTIYLMFQFVFWFGVGSQTSVITFQITPLPLCSSIISLAGGFYWLLDIAKDKFLIFMIDRIHPFGTFWFYTGTSALGLVLIVFVIIPEINKDISCIVSTSMHNECTEQHESSIGIVQTD